MQKNNGASKTLMVFLFYILAKLAMFKQCLVYKIKKPRECPKRQNNHSGFTLIEILFALFIFSIIALLMSNGLHRILQSQSETEKKAAQLAELQFTLLLLARDIEQAVDRPAIDINDQLSGFIGMPDSVTFTHMGLMNPNDVLPRPTIQRVQYQFQKNKLFRITWPLPDQTAKSIAEKRLLLNDIEQFKFSWLDSTGYFHDTWPATTGPNQHLPQGVRIAMQLKNFGKITQLYLIPGQSFANTG